MKIEKFVHVDVDKDGYVKGGGVVCTYGKIIIGNGEHKTTNHPTGYFMTIIHPRSEDGIVEGSYVEFENQKEYFEFLQKGELFL